MSTREYQLANRRAQNIIESDEYSAIFVCGTKIDSEGNTDTEVVSGVDSSTIEEGHGQIRLQEAAMHLQYLADLSGMSPMELAGSIARVIERGDVEIDVLEG